MVIVIVKPSSGPISWYPLRPASPVPPVFESSARSASDTMVGKKPLSDMADSRKTFTCPSASAIQGVYNAHEVGPAALKCGQSGSEQFAAGIHWLHDESGQHISGSHMPDNQGRYLVVKLLKCLLRHFGLGAISPWGI
jgi:hypothetical protein